MQCNGLSGCPVRKIVSVPDWDAET
jgi:hypothetical protein